TASTMATHVYSSSAKGQSRFAQHGDGLHRRAASQGDPVRRELQLKIPTRGLPRGLARSRSGTLDPDHITRSETARGGDVDPAETDLDRKSTRLNSSH